MNTVLDRYLATSSVVRRQTAAGERMWCISSPIYSTINPIFYRMVFWKFGKNTRYFIGRPNIDTSEKACNTSGKYLYCTTNRTISITTHHPSQTRMKSTFVTITCHYYLTASKTFDRDRNRTCNHSMYRESPTGVESATIAPHSPCVLSKPNFHNIK